MVEVRTWGDGGNDVRLHVIESIDYGRLLIGCRCGTAIRFRSPEDTAPWIAHSGKLHIGVGAGLASDEEVAEFMKGVEDPDYRSKPASEMSSTPDADVESAFTWLALVQEMQSRCTCETTAIMDCPNYVEGDEIEFDTDG